MSHKILYVHFVGFYKSREFVDQLSNYKLIRYLWSLLVTGGDVPEELKLSVMECVTSLLKRASSDVVCEFYSREYAPKLAQGIYVAIQMAQWEKLRSLRCDFYRTLLVILR
jgi:hypothetical protein